MSPSDNKDSGPGTEQWSFETGGSVRSSPTVVGGVVYVGSYDDTLYAVDWATGTEQWSFKTGGSVRSSPTVVDGVVYVGSYDDTLYAVDARTGTEQWFFRTGARIRSSPTVVDGTVYVGSYDHNLYAVDARTGTEQWFFRTGARIRSSPAVVDGVVYVGSMDGNLYVVDAGTGTKQWSFETGGSVRSSPTVVDGTVYVGSDDHNLYAVDARTGTEQWSSKIRDRIWSSPMVVDGTVYVGSDDHNLYAVDARTGTEQWRFETGGSVRSSPMVVDGAVYVGSNDQNLYAITASSRPESRGIQPSKYGSAVSRSSTSERSTRTHQEGIEAGTEQIPDLQEVRSPRRHTLSPGDFEKIEDLGHGGQAVVKKLRLPNSKASPGVVALREPAAAGTMTREAVEEFLKSAETWETIDARERDKQRWERSEHIVGVIDTGDRLPWIAMEYMDGGDLNELLGEHPDGLPVEQALWTGECVCQGLEIAHQLGRVHLDVKPGNVLMTQTDGWPWPKLADWGLARTLAKETGTMEGRSVEYAGPEQFDSSTFGDPDQLTDIYQTGALVYALLTGGPPVTGSQFEVMQQIMSEGSIAAPSDRRPELPAVVDTAVELALERQKTDRYDSITDLRKTLRAIRTNERLPRAVTTRLGE